MENTNIARPPERRRSTGYPGVDLDSAILITKKVHEYGSMDRETLARVLGHESLSGPALAKLAAVRHFGLVEYKEGKVSLSELGKRIIAPLSEEEKKQATAEAFLKARPFDELYRDRRKEIALEKDMLINIATRQLGIMPKAASEFLEVFVRSGKTAGLIEEINEKSVRLLEQPFKGIITEEVAPAEGIRAPAEAERKTIPKITEPARGFTRTLNVNLTIDSSMEPEKLEQLIKILKSELGLQAS